MCYDSPHPGVSRSRIEPSMPPMLVNVALDNPVVRHFVPSHRSIIFPFEESIDTHALLWCCSLFVPSVFSPLPCVAFRALRARSSGSPWEGAVVLRFAPVIAYPSRLARFRVWRSCLPFAVSFAFAAVRGHVAFGACTRKGHTTGIEPTTPRNHSTTGPQEHAHTHKHTHTHPPSGDREWWKETFLLISTKTFQATPTTPE